VTAVMLVADAFSKSSAERVCTHNDVQGVAEK